MILEDFNTISARVLEVWDRRGALVVAELRADDILRPVPYCPSSSGTPKLFGGSNCDIKSIYDSFRNAYPGETGPRNYIRLPGYMNVDLGLAKTWTMPWSEKQVLQLRWDVFNVANFTKPAPGQPALISFSDVTTIT